MLLYWTSFLLLAASEPVVFKARDFTVEIKAELKSLFKDLAAALGNKENANDGYNLLVKRYGHVKNMPNFEWLLHSSRSTRYIWARIGYRMNSMKVRLQNPNADSSSSINISEQQAIHLIRELFLAAKNVSTFVENHGPKLGYNAALTVVDTYKLLQKAMVLDDRKRTKLEEHHIEILIDVYKYMGSLFTHYPEIMSEKSVTASEAQLDSGRELEGKELQLFVDSLSQIEKEIVKTVGDITVVVLDRICYASCGTILKNTGFRSTLGMANGTCKPTSVLFSYGR